MQLASAFRVKRAPTEWVNEPQSQGRSEVPHRAFTTGSKGDVVTPSSPWNRRSAYFRYRILTGMWIVGLFLNCQVEDCVNEHAEGPGNVGAAAKAACCGPSVL